MKDRLNGSFLLLALVLSNFTGYTLGNKFVKFIQDHYIVRLSIIYILIFLTIRYTSDYPNHFEHFKRTTMIFLIYLMAVKSSLPILLIVIFMIIMNHILNHHIEYLEDDKKEEHKKEIQNLNYYSISLTKIIVITVICGFIYKVYHKSRNKNFLFIKYITTQS